MSLAEKLTSFVYPFVLDSLTSPEPSGLLEFDLTCLKPDGLRVWLGFWLAWESFISLELGLDKFYCSAELVRVFELEDSST